MNGESKVNLQELILSNIFTDDLQVNIISLSMKYVDITKVDKMVNNCKDGELIYSIMNLLF